MTAETRRPLRILFLACLAAMLLHVPSARAADSGVEFPGPSPGAAHAERAASLLTLRNDVIAESWEVAGNRLRPATIENRLTGERFGQAGREVFRLAVSPNVLPQAAADSKAVEIAAGECALTAPPVVIKLRGDRHGVRVADRIGGEAIEADLVSPSGVRVHWHAELRDGSSYVRQTIAIAANAATVPIALSHVELSDIAIPAAATIGTTPGCPVVGRGLYFGVEMPGAQNLVLADSARIGFDCRLQLAADSSLTFGAVAGVAPEGQLRRAFLFYIERERARPSQPFLHYNDWYDLGMDVTAAKIADVATQYERELVKKRGVPVQSFLIDDGWDNPTKDLWQENPARFPEGFHGVDKTLSDFGAHMSLWISPLGGYSYANERTAFAQKMGLIPTGSGLDLSQPGYKAWFQARCLQLMREDGVNAFKWDRAGDGVSPHFMALLDIAHHLRQQNPDLFINVTVGTWPSPFWLNHIDSTWRNGSGDVGWTGKGDNRAQWNTFRDGYCHKLFVEKSPLYPLNSIMHHGMVLGRVYQGERLGTPGPNFKSDARAYFANGTMLQELYITPSLMTPETWDQLAEAIRWAHANADVLVDSHWVGGDPLKLEPYGYAAWNRRKGTLMLRNPDDAPRTIDIDASRTFDLPAGAPQRYALHAAYADQRVLSLSLDGTKPVTVTLQPFEVLVFDAEPLHGAPVSAP